MRGRITKGIGGFYYVYTADGIYTCKAKGVFRKDGKKPLVGDFVEVEASPNEDMIGSISQIYERKNTLVRPNVANIDQALIIFALKSPDPNFITLDKMILQYALYDIPVILCFNKEDLAGDDFCAEVVNDYKDSGCNIYVTSAKGNEGIDELKKALNGRVSAVAGPSGAGKSTIINCLSNKSVMETGDISQKLARGKHTTRHSEIIPLWDDTFIMDTPGFSSFDLYDIEAEDLAGMYNEFRLSSECKFKPCSHTHEPGCVIKEYVNSGNISKRRYDNYTYIFGELSKMRRY